MTDQQQIEKWWKEFLVEGRKSPYPICLTFESLSEDVDDKKNYHMLEQFGGFLLAKRAQKPVELPIPHNSDGFRYFHEMDVAHCIEAAGYTYTVKGD